MQEKGFDINNNILHFIHNDSDYLINLDLLEMMSLYKDSIIFVEYGKVKMVPSIIFNLVDLTVELLDNPNFMVCGRNHIINMKYVKSQNIESYKNGEGYSDQHTLVLTFNNGRKEGVHLNSWREAERLYHQIDDKLCEIKGNQI